MLLNQIDFRRMGDLSIICLEDIVSGLLECDRNELNFDQFVEIILSKDLLDFCLILLSFLKLIALFDHETQRILFKKMFMLSNKHKETAFKKKLGLILIWCWNNIETLAK